MSLDIWCKEDLKNVLFSINVASATTARFSDAVMVAAYRQGFEDALNTACIALGIKPTRIVKHGEPCTAASRKIQE